MTDTTLHDEPEDQPEMVDCINAKRVPLDDAEPVSLNGLSMTSYLASFGYVPKADIDDLVEQEEIAWVEDPRSGMSMLVLWQYTVEDCEDSDNRLLCHVAIEICGYYYSPDSDNIRTDHRGDYFHVEDNDYVFCEDLGDYCHIEEAHYCEHCEEYRFGDESGCSHCCNAEGRILQWGQTRDSILYRGTSPWLVGFEIEANSVEGARRSGDEVEETELFAYWTTDSTCGVEGITHAYDPRCPETSKMFLRHLDNASHLVDSPSDKSCGGHINISHREMSQTELFVKFRQYAGIWWALFRHRLDHHYSGCYNRRMESGSEKYSPVKVKGYCIELRLPRRVQSATVLKRRFMLIAETCRAIDEGLTEMQFLRNCLPILREVFGNDRKKIAEVLHLARLFQSWISSAPSNYELESRSSARNTTRQRAARPHAKIRKWAE
jgi:hypothetical protein